MVQDAPKLSQIFDATATFIVQFAQIVARRLFVKILDCMPMLISYIQSNKTFVDQNKKKGGHLNFV